jgi:hypothetical protein
LVVSAEWVD